MFTREKKAGLLVSVVIAGLGMGAGLGINGCSTEPIYTDIYCIPDANPEADIYGYCFPSDGGSGLEPLSCKAAGGDCVELGTADFRQQAILLWIGAEEEAPACPKRADSEFYAGHSDLKVAFECAKCTCGPARCNMSNAMNADPDHFCQGANAKSYAGPADWDGSCVSPSIEPAGSFSSIKLVPATVSPCEAIGDPIPKAPGFAPGPKSFSEGVYWGKYAKGCQGAPLAAKCEKSGDLCLPTAEPPPPGFRQCIQYILPVEENQLPQCPSAFPEQFVFYGGRDGKPECSPCKCGEAVGAQCDAVFSAYQDPACTGQQMPLFKDVPAGPGFCVDLGGASFALGSMKAKWATNTPGTCEPSGGELIGDVKGTDPRLFCCQPPPSPSPQ